MGRRANGPLHIMTEVSAEQQPITSEAPEVRQQDAQWLEEALRQLQKEGWSNCKRKAAECNEPADPCAPPCDPRWWHCSSSMRQRDNQPITLHSFCLSPTYPKEKNWHKLDIDRVLRIYLDRTAAFQRSVALFMAYGAPNQGKKVSSGLLDQTVYYQGL
ncbi:UNVERIFIED_CONTAM: hypothetical protein K2H54_050131 [Gekko kuhli]